MSLCLEVTSIQMITSKRNVGSYMISEKIAARIFQFRRDGSVCKVITQDTDNFDEEVKPLASAR